ncbi:MAG: bifunctional diaminohydroxyphosphoribosylaminopyrimidine deaminase/5-amino-6-(5-phosphoribosylamino)uracil reductase RibD [Candidatus Obscuribacterales bacterium]|nr:bifunctional diaminohydroxyphosphoribosylaminopyrimidine deaminase/5-amino-6-(5-phosphoribosylamino)uracil reductase RibD [Candidatus Obscuribacterales bacterium]
MNADQKWMRRCIELALQAEGRTSPNPMVGAVLLSADGEFLSEGFHPKAGEAHAEVFALDKAGERARGGTLYVNLEPCSHFGRTPPCADRVIASGVKRVVLGMKDPNPKVCGKGIERLQAAGIELSYSELETECRNLNRAFIKRIETGLPYLTLKIASTLDGRIADRYGKSRWISGPQARVFVHQVRNKTDCVLIGAKTAVLDDPELNVRELLNSRNPHKAVIDPELQTMPTARLCRQDQSSGAETFLFCSPEKLPTAPKYPESVKLVSVSSDREKNLEESLRYLAAHDIQSVLCEGGARLAAALLEKNLVDEIIWIIAAKLFTDAKARAALDGSLAVPVQNCLQLSESSCRLLGEDFLIQGKIKKS